MRRKGHIGEDLAWPRDFLEKRFLEVAKPPTQCTNTSAPASICGPRVALSVTGAVFLNNKWSPDMEFLCRATQLGDKKGNGSHGGGLNENMNTPCQEIWDTEVGGYT